MNKQDLVAAVEGRLGNRRLAADAVEVVLETIVKEVAKGNRVSLTGFGTFEKVARAARTGRNPRTGETVRIRKTSVPRFSASTKFKDYVKNPKSMPKGTPVLARASAKTAAPASTAKAATTSKAATAKSTARSAAKTAPARVAKTAAAKTASKATASKAAAKSATRPTAKRVTKAAKKA
ncbi:MAG: HU family DNA-binding protein [Tetrasphaera sp.]